MSLYVTRVRHTNQNMVNERTSGSDLVEERSRNTLHGSFVHLEEIAQFSMLSFGSDGVGSVLILEVGLLDVDVGRLSG